MDRRTEGMANTTLTLAVHCAKRLGRKQLRAVEWHKPRRLTAGQVHHRAPVWSHDGRWLALLCGDGADAVWLLCDPKGRPARALPGPAAGGVSFARDGALALTVVFGRQVGATEELWQLGLGAPEPQRLLGGDGALYRDPAHSPCGRFLAFAVAPAEQPTRLQLLDLRSGAHTVLPAPAELRDAALSRPAWSPAADRLFFEVVQGEEVAVWVQELASGRCARLTPPGLRERRPAPLSPEALIVEREREDGSSELWLLVVDEAGAVLRSRRLVGRARGPREPAIAFRKGAAYLCCAMLCSPGDGDLQRYDLYCGRLSGLPVVSLGRLAAEGEGGGADAARAATAGAEADAAAETGTDARAEAQTGD